MFEVTLTFVALLRPSCWQISSRPPLGDYPSKTVLDIDQEWPGVLVRWTDSTMRVWSKGFHDY